jgi:hypothetical protein
MRLVLVIAAVLLLVGCGGGQDGVSHEGLVGALRGEGIDPQSPKPEPPGVLEVSSSAYDVPGGVLHVFPFETEHEAQRAQARIEPDGSTIQTTSGINQVVDWSGPPHWFRKGREIGLYIGSSSEVLDALDKAAGPQFAGAG